RCVHSRRSRSGHPCSPRGRGSAPDRQADRTPAAPPAPARSPFGAPADRCRAHGRRTAASFAGSAHWRAWLGRPAASAGEKAVDLIEEARPCGLTLEDEVVAALERNEARVLDAGRQTPPFLEGYSRIAAAMHHQRWGPDLRQKLLDVDLRRRSQAPHRVLRG